MKNQYAKFLVIAVLISLASGCAGGLRHGVLMKGQVIKVNSDNSLVVCVGTNDGAKVGQVLDAYRYVVRHSVEEGRDQFLRNELGKVSIQEIVNEHYAIAKVINGSVQINDMVQLVEAEDK